MSDLQVMLRIKADGSGASGVIRNTKGELIDLGKAADASAGGARNAADAQRELGSATAETGRRAGVASRLWGEFGPLLRSLGFIEVARQIIVAGNALNGMQAALTAATGSSEQAAEEIAFVRAEAQRLGIDLQAAAKSYTGLTAAARGTNLEGRASREIFTAVAEAGRVMNLSAAETQGALTAVQQIISKGTVSAEELRGQLGERLPGAFQIAARAMGVTTAELGKMLEAGELTAEEFLPKFAAELRNASAAGLEAARNSPAAEFTRLKNAVFELAGAIAQSGLLDLLGEVARNLTELIRVSSDAVKALTSLRDGIRTLEQAQAEADARQRQWAETSRVAAEAARKQAETQTRGLSTVRAELLSNQRALERVVRVQGQESALAQELLARRKLLLAELQRSTKANQESARATAVAAAAVSEAGSRAAFAAPQIEEFASAVGECTREAVEAADPLAEFNRRIDQLVRSVEDMRVDQVAADMAQLQIAIEDAMSQGNTERANQLRAALEALGADLRTVPEAAENARISLAELMSRGGEFRIEMALAEAIEAGWRGGIQGFGAKLKEIFQLAKKDLAGSINSAAQFAAFSVDQFRQNPDAPLRAVANIAAQIPGPIGQIAQAVQAIDSIFGGRLLGTNYQVNQTGANLSVGAGGASGSTFVQETRQRSFFRGTARRTTTTALDPAAQRAIDDFFRSLQTAVAQAARALSVEAAAVVQGTFREVRDKNGNIKEQFSTVNGRRFNEDQTAFQQRITAESLIATIANSAAEASAIAERWRANAAQLLEGAQLMLIAQGEIVQGVSVLNTGAGLAGVVDLVQRLASPGENLVDAYQRISGATKLLDEALRLSGVTLDRTREQVIEFAAGIAEAAGGLEQAAGLWQDYFNRFYSPEERAQAVVDQATTNRNSLLDELGIDRNIGLAEFRALFEEQLPNLSAEATVKWLRAARAIGLVIDAEEDLADVREGAAAVIRDAAGIGEMLDQLRFDESLVGLSDLDRQLAILAREANEAALAAAELGATEAELAEIREIYAARRVRLERQAAEQAIQEAADYWAQIAAYNQQATQQVADAIRSAFGGLAEWIRGEMFSETSTLTPAEQFAAAQAQFQDMLARAAAGDQNAAAGIQGAAQQLLQQGLSFLGGGDAWRQLREAVLGALGPLAALGQSGSADAGALAGGPAAALRRFLELMRGFGIGPNAIGVGGLGFGPAANGTLTVPQGLALPGVGGGSGNVLSVSPLVLDRSFAVQDQQLQKLGLIESRLGAMETAIRAASDAQVGAINRLSSSGARFG